MSVFSYIAEIIKHDYPSLPAEVQQEAEKLIKARLTRGELAAYHEEGSPNKKLEKPLFCQVGGIPGSGKSTFCRQSMHNGVLPADAVLVKFDDVMMSLSGYQQDKQELTEQLGAEAGLKQAFTNWEPMARTIGYELLDRAIKSHRNIVFENSGAYLGHVELLKWLQENKDYHCKFYYMNCPLETAIERVAIRNQRGEMYIGEQMIKDRHQSLTAGLEKYQAVVAEFVEVLV